MSHVSRSVAAVLALGIAAACAAKRLPPGTPPPEYETRELPPWSGDAVDAGTDAPAPAEVTPVPAEAPAPPAPSAEPPAEPQVVDAGAGPSPDAGVR